MAQPLETEPRDLLLGSDNDLVVTTDLDFSRGVQAVAQSAGIALRMFAGEWFLDLDAGIPYWQSILGEKRDVGLAAARLAFRSELEAVIGVLDVLKLELSFTGPTRTLAINWQVSTSYGDTPEDSIALKIGGA